MKKGLILAAIHLALAMSVVAKFAYDRQTLPREWVRADAVDPYLPLRGRYIRLQLRGDSENLRGTVAFFIPANAPDPSMHPGGEELWVEVSVPRTGSPRPIRLGIKRDAGIEPLDLR